jgi:hypothetical protein
VAEFVDEITVLSGRLGRDVAADLSGVVPLWNAFRFRDAVVFVAEGPESAGRMYLVRGQTVREFPLSQVSIDQAYALLDVAELPAVA